MARIGRCCCEEGCTECCLDRIDVTFGEPEPGEPGASIGSWGWDITTQPVSEEVTQTIEGVPRLVCRQIYDAPTTDICPGNTLLANTYFLTKTRTIPYTYWQREFFGTHYWFEGDMLWRAYSVIRSLRLTVYTWGSLARTVLEGTISHVATYQPTIGSRIRQYSSAGCALVSDFTYTDDSEYRFCSRTAECRTTNFFSLEDGLWKADFASINRDSGWVTGACATLPTTDTSTAGICTDSYNPGASAGLCRMPSSSTYALGAVSLSCTQGGANYHLHNYNYASETVWFCRHPISLTVCA